MRTEFSFPIAPEEEAEYREYRAHFKSMVDEFDKEYKAAHLCCPACGFSGDYASTYVGYIVSVGLDGVDRSYRDDNLSGCRCGHNCTVHDRISEAEWAAKA